MAKITWVFQNESGTNLNRYIATNVITGEEITFDLLRGANISVVGTPLNAEKLNSLITAINACYDELDNLSKTMTTLHEQSTSYTDSKSASTLNVAKTYADTQATSALNNAKIYTNSKSSTTLESAKSYADGVASQEAQVSLNSAITYTNNRVATLITYSNGTLTINLDN